MSQANYVIICSGRGRVKASSKPADQVVAAMDCAAQVVAFVTLSAPSLSPEVEQDIDQISALQHSMMDILPDVKKAEAGKLTSDMFTLLDALEQKLNEA